MPGQTAVAAVALALAVALIVAVGATWTSLGDAIQQWAGQWIGRSDVTLRSASLTELPRSLVPKIRKLNGAETVAARLRMTLAASTERASFFLKAWAACQSIPRGETRSYAWLATQAGRPGALRAAGQAMAHNPIPILIPCHRVIGSDGSLYGYGGGLKLKQRLLDLERAARL